MPLGLSLFACRIVLGLALLGAGLCAAARGEPLPRHELTVSLDPAAQTLRATDRIQPGHSGRVEFLLNARLAIIRATPALREIPLGFDPGAGNASLKRYVAEGIRPGEPILVEYGGKLDSPLGAAKEEYTRGFRTTAGLIAGEGVYLSGASAWYPQLGSDLLEFSLAARSPSGWQLISEGTGMARDEDGEAHWRSDGPVDEIHLVGGPLQRYGSRAGAIETLAFLREPDDALAAKYLAATGRYLDLYNRLIGPYPYGKFALVENFWETGEGMPSFTLLGPKIIRFPFILDSSYPHEILHNWWGNSVFVDYERGNWCEGLTAYLADHLIQEQAGKAEEYRRGSLEKYRDYVGSARDFPLTEFRSRHSAATEAVGYGRALMGFHMLRRALGDEGFRAFLARFYGDYRGRRATFQDVRQVAEKVSGLDLGRFFRDWTERTGAPRLRLRANAVRDGGKWRVAGVLTQVQSDTPFAVTVPLVIQTATGTLMKELPLQERGADFAYEVDDEPLAIYADPYYDVFRHLEAAETPLTIGRLFGAPRVLALLPARATPEEIAAYRALAQAWNGESQAVAIGFDTDYGQLPGDRPVWLLGRDNAWAGRLFRPDTALSMGPDEMAFNGERLTYAGHSAALARLHPGNSDQAIGWIILNPLAAGPTLARKLPHYGRYSYLGFAGAEANNVIKGRWPAGATPLRADLRPEGGRTLALPPLKPPRRRPLAELPPSAAALPR